MNDVQLKLTLKAFKKELDAYLEAEIDEPNQPQEEEKVSVSDHYQIINQTSEQMKKDLDEIQKNWNTELHKIGKMLNFYGDLE